MICSFGENRLKRIKIQLIWSIDNNKLGLRMRNRNISDVNRIDQGIPLFGQLLFQCIEVYGESVFLNGSRKQTALGPENLITYS